MNRYKSTLFMLFSISCILFIFYGDSFIFTLFKGGQEYNKATYEIQNNNIQSAIELLNMSINKNPLFSEAYLNLGFAYTQDQQYELAENAFLTAIDLFSKGKFIETKDQISIEEKLVQAHKNLSILVYQPLMNKAASEGSPELVNDYYEKFKSHIQTASQTSTQQDSLTSILNSFDKKFPLILSDGFYNQAANQVNQNDLENAVKSLHDSIHQYPLHLESLILLGLLYQNSHDLNHALEYYLKALSVDTENIRLLNSISEIYSQLKDWSHAIEYYNKSLDVNPDQSNVIYNLAIFYNENSQYDQALKCWKQYLEMNPDASDKVEVQSMIDRLQSNIQK